MDTPTQPSPTTATGPEQSRLVGRSRVYTGVDLSPRLRHWHAPRVNRWEKLCVESGELEIEYLLASGIARAQLAAADTHWFAPGMRWRVAEIPTDARFTLEIHADSRGQAKSPQPLRSRVLQQTGHTHLADTAAFHAFLAALPMASRHIVHGHFPMPFWNDVPKGPGHLFWHPLQAGADGFCVLVARSGETFDLATYLGRDHAIIEAALGQALEGDARADAWMRASLERHLHIEEDLVFPAWLAVGGQPAHVDGLLHEHEFLREHLATFDDPESRRKLLRLLDAHDEKEEQIVYPDVVARLGAEADTLLQRAIGLPLS